MSWKNILKKDKPNWKQLDEMFGGDSEAAFKEVEEEEEVEEESKPHLTWMDPSKTVGWKDGVLNMALDNWASANRGGYTESISDTYKEHGFDEVEELRNNNGN